MTEIVPVIGKSKNSEDDEDKVKSDDLFMQYIAYNGEIKSRKAK